MSFIVSCFRCLRFLIVLPIIVRMCPRPLLAIMCSCSFQDVCDYSVCLIVSCSVVYPCCELVRFFDMLVLVHACFVYHVCSYYCYVLSVGFGAHLLLVGLVRRRDCLVIVILIVFVLCCLCCSSSCTYVSCGRLSP